MTVRLIGDKLSRKHGENNCRLLLAGILREKGEDVQVCYKLSLDALRYAPVIVLFPGGGKPTVILEFCILLLHLFRRSQVVIWYHNSAFGRWGSAARLLKKLGDVTELCLTKHQVRDRPGAVYFPNTVPSSDLRARQVKKLVFLSRLEKAKGVDTTWRAFCELYRHDSEWTLELVGPDGDWQPPESHPAITFHGPKWNYEKYEVLSSSGVFILPSVYENETQPLVVIEALSVGLPVVISTHNGIHELIEGQDSIAGAAVGVQASPQEYARAIAGVYDNWRSHSAAAIKISSTVYSNDAFRRRVDEVFGARLQ